MLNPIFNVVEEKIENEYGKFVIEPLEPGFGNTLGVALRRVLLSNIEGVAITSVKIDSIRHVFTTLTGLKEDIVEFILNLKGIRVKFLDSKDEATVVLNKKGKGEITAGDIEVEDGVEIVNPKHYLGSLTDAKAKINMEMTVARGLGYSLAEERKVSTIGIIPIDAIFSPILKVSYRIEQTRVGRQTNYDKLILELWTDGTVSSRNALNESAKIIVSYFRNIYQPREEEKPEEIEISSKIPESFLKMTVDELDLPTRIYNSLKNAGIDTVGQILGTPRRELMNFRNLGAKSLAVIEESLKAKGIPFNN